MSVFLFCIILIVLLLVAIIYEHLAVYFLLIVIVASLSYLLYLNKKNIYDFKYINNMIERSICPIQILDVGGNIEYVNPAFLKWSQLSKESLIGKNVVELFKNLSDGSLIIDVWPKIKSVLEQNKEWSKRVELETGEGKKVASMMTITPIFNDKWQLSQCIVQHTDITELDALAKKYESTQKQYESIVENSIEGVIIVQDGDIKYVNPSAIRLLGYQSLDELLKMKIVDIVAPQNREEVSFKIEGKPVGEVLLRNCEIRGLTKSRKVIDLEINAVVVDWNDKLAVQVTLRDITERKMLEREQALWLWEQETLSEIDRKLVGVIDLQEILTSILQHTLNLTKANFSGVLLIYDSVEQVEWKVIRGNTVDHEIVSFKPNDALKRILRNEEPEVIHLKDQDTNSQLKETPVVKEEKLVSTAWIPLRSSGKQQGKLVVGYRQFHDFGGREIRLLISLAEKYSIAMVNAKLYSDLLSREKELEVLSGAFVKAQEEERRRIAREIHDGLGQMLTAIKFNLEILEDVIKVDKDGQERIDDMKNLLDDVMREARELSYNLMPSVLEDFGLVPALQLLSEQFSNRTKIKVNYQAHGFKERIDSAMEIGLYRIAQEALNNVAKHAEATEVNLQIVRHSEGVRLMVEDNGKGMAIENTMKRTDIKKGIGLMSMRERAFTLGGVLNIDSSPGNGTLITVEIPI